MHTENLIAGTPEWHAHRARHFNASDAPAMLGCSPYMTRAALLRKLHTGIGEEHDAGTERRFADGHRFEALARPLAEKIIGDDLAPVVGTLGELSASFDGLTLMGDTAFEHKTLNDELRALRWEEGNGWFLPKHYQTQMEQQLLVSGAERVLFMASKWGGDDGDTLVEERHCWYASDPKLRAELLAGWRQLAQDLANYQPEPAAEAAPVGRAPESLPALRIEVTGMVTASNLDAFKATALGAIRSVNRELSTDRQFADAEQAVKWCGDVEERLKAAKQHALSQTESIDALFRAIDEIGAEARTVRLELEKLVKARKEAIRGEIVAAGVAALRAHTDALTARLDKPYLPVIAADFGGKIKGLKSVSSIRDAVDGELARAKIHASELADRIEANLKAMNAANEDASFHDDATLALKQPDDLAAIIAQRVAETRQAREAQRERIRAEEQAKADREAERIQVNLNNLRLYRPDDSESSAWHRDRIAALEADPLTEAVYGRRVEEAKAMHATLLDDLRTAVQAASDDEAADRHAAEAAKPAPIPAPVVIASPAPVSQAPNVVPMQRAAAPAEAATLKLGEINARLGFTMTAEFVGSLGVVGVRDRSAMLYRESQFQTLCDALLRHVTQVAQSELAAA
jgi:putative phage-type endonuclease